MDDILAAEMLRRIIAAEKRIAALEEVLVPEPTVDTDIEEESASHVGSQQKRVTTRQRAITELGSQLAEAGTGIRIEGRANRGQNPSNLLRAVATDSSEHRLYLAASGNYWDSPEAFSAWHTVKLGAIKNDDYEAFVLSAEDENGDVRFFCFSRSSMVQITNEKLEGLSDTAKTDTTLIHFYPSGTGSTGSGFTDQRDEEPRDLDPYFNNWDALIGTAH